MTVKDPVESRRLDALRAYGVLDTGPERVFDELVELAAAMCATPIALICLLDEQRQRFKARLGTGVDSLERASSFCDHVVRTGQLLVVPDVSEDELWATHPLVLDGRPVRSYAGAPLITPDSHVIGSLCVLDRVARPFSDEQLAALQKLARRVMSLLHGRQVAERLAAEIAASSRVRRELARATRFQQTVLDAVGSGVLVCDEDGQFVVRNVAHRALFGDTDKSPVHAAIDGDELTDHLVQVAPPRDGDPRELRLTTRRLRDETGRVLGAWEVAVDVTAERRAQQELRSAVAFKDAVLAASRDVTFVVDLQTHHFLWVSANFVDVLGHDAQELSEHAGLLVDFLSHPDDVPLLKGLNARVAAAPDGAVIEERYRARHGDGTYHWMSQRITPFRRAPDGRLLEALGVARDISDVVAAEERLRHAALHDMLTGLPNRLLLTDRIEGAQARARRGRSPFAVLMCDLDGFKTVNDTAGHDAGDAVLVEVARRIRGVVRAQDTVARFGGDEFVVLVEPDPLPSAPGRSAPDASFIDEEVDRVVARITGALEAPVTVGERAFALGISVGVAFADADSDTNSVLSRADHEMYRAKFAGRLPAS